MNNPTYPLSTNETLLDYEFESVGPHGKVKKVVRYSPRNSQGITYFNLGFGDWNEETKQINDESRTNNNDRDKVLNTVAVTVLDFMEHFPDTRVYAQGSTPARTRLYQMGISLNWAEIEPKLQVFGFTNGGWEHFRKNVNYEAFLVARK